MADIPRFFIPADKIFNGKFELEDPQDIKKIRKVLRLKQGDLIELNNNQGGIFTAEIEKLQKSDVKGIIKNESENIKNQTISKPHIILAQALPKGSKMDDIIRMCTEVGVDEFIPFENEYCVIRLKDLGDKRLSKKMQRWEKIAKEASRQSERNHIPVIHKPVSFQNLLDFKADHKLVLHSREENSDSDIHEVKNEIKPRETVLVLIGPEGGFSNIELESFPEDFKTIHLNLPILRTQTAGVVIAGILLY